MSCQSTWFLNLTILNIISILVHTFTLFNRYDVLAYSSVLLLIASCCYWAYMYFLEKERSSESTEGQGLITERNTNFMADNVFRYLFVIVIGNTIYCIVFRIRLHTYYSGNDAIKILSTIIFNWYSYTVLPIACIIDFLGRKRNRTPNPKYDLIITLIFIALISFIDSKNKYIYTYYSFLEYFIVSVLLNTLFMALSYFIYDYILFKMNGGQSYTLCPQETQA